MLIYIAAKYNRRLDDDVKNLRKKLEELGHEITAQWLDNAEESKSLEDAAQMDVLDVVRAESLIFLGEPRGSENRGGGRWFEFGLAWGAGKKIYAVLPSALDEKEERRDESVFTALNRVRKFDSIDQLIEFFAAVDPNSEGLK